MKKAKRYAQALSLVLEGVSEEESKKIAQRFKLLLQKRGDLRLLSEILKEFSHIQEEKKGKIAQVFTATEFSKEMKDIVEDSLQKEGYQMKEQVESVLIGGTAIMVGNEYMIDGTIRGKIQRLWKSIEIT